MKITRVECSVLQMPDASPHSLNTAHDNAVVQIFTDVGLTGIGEVESNPWVIKAFIDASGNHSMDLGLGEILVGQDPTQPAIVWELLYRQSLMAGRRGAGINAIGALDIAIWDVYGKAAQQPIWKLLGGSQRRVVNPYASLLPCGNTLDAYRENLLAKATWARDAGFKAVKAEVMIKGPYAQPGLQESDEAIAQLVAECRQVVGSSIELMVDVGYCWSDWKDALKAIRRMERHNLFFIETPLPTDDLEGYARLSRATDVRIAAGELLSTRFEFGDLLGAVDVLQPDVGRVGGITEAMKIVEMAANHGKLVVPHCWKSAIGVAATAHVAAASPNCPLIEFLPAPVSDSQLRRELVLEELKVENGTLSLPEQPGLGVDLNQDIMEKFTVTWGHLEAGVQAKV